MALKTNSAAFSVPKSLSSSSSSSSSSLCINDLRRFGVRLPVQRCKGGSSLRFLVYSSIDGGNANYVVPLDKSFSSPYSSCITRPLAEILRDLNKRIPDNIIRASPTPNDRSAANIFITWYHANRMLSFYAPGWCGEIRDVIFSDKGSVTVVYRVTVRGSDGEAHRESTGTVSSTDGCVDPVAAAEEIAFCKACARFGLGLYLYHEE